MQIVKNTTILFDPFSKAMCFPIVFREKEKAPTETL